PAPATHPAGPRTVLGQPQDNPYGTVQVKVTLAGGRITDVQAVQLPTGGRSGDIAAYAAPRLRAEVLAAQSASIDTVSGASYDSEGYARSVQSALDAAPR
ncbi:MAG TPA: FMN-binding protein, partial [Nakamurella sp.]